MAGKSGSVRSEGRPCDARSVTCSGCRASCAGRVRCATPTFRPDGLRPAPKRLPPQVRGGGVLHDGYWVDFGHRDGHDVGDCQVGWHHGVEAAREAGVDIALRRVTTPLRVHQLPDGRVTTGGDWSAAGLVAMAGGTLALRHEDEAQLHAIVGLLTGAGPADVAHAVHEKTGACLGRHTAGGASGGDVIVIDAVVCTS